jgi:hypothetical protein
VVEASCCAPTPEATSDLPAKAVETSCCGPTPMPDASVDGALTTAGFTDIEIRPTHRVHAHARAAIIRASH